MDDKSFLYLTQDDVLEKMNIDPRLIDSFKRVMARQQEYFNANGYTSQRDYKEFFEQYVLKDLPDKLKIIISDEPNKSGAAGFYRHRGGVQEIHIDESCLKYSAEDLDAVLSHEFIHFLVMRGLDKIEYPDPEIKNGGFINEALTEMLNQQIYPNSRSYMPQVDMLKFANSLTGNVNNYSLFLQGKVDSKRGASSWINFVENVAKYHKEWVDKGFRMSQAVVDPNYIYAQQKLIEANIKTHLISSFEEYEKWISIISQRPAPDTEWIEQFKNSMEQGLLNKMNIRDPKMRLFLEEQLKEYRSLTSKLSEYGNQDVIEFEIAGHKIAIDKNRRVFNTDRIPYQATWNPSTNMYEFKVGDEVVKIDMATADFSKRRTDIEKRLKDIPHIFSKSLDQDFRMLNQNINTNGLQKIERFQLPNVEQSNKPIYVYVATYSDHIEILDSPIKLGAMQNVNHSQYIGITSKINGAIYQKGLSQITEGLTFSTLKEENMDSKIQTYLYKQYKGSITEEQLNQIIEQYKKSSEYNSEDEKRMNSFRDLAIGYYARTRFANLSVEERKKLYDKVIESSPQYIVSTKDGQLDISVLFGKEYITAFQGKSEAIVDMNSDALFNEYFFELQKGENLSNETNKECVNISIDEKGNMVLPNQNPQEEIEQTPQEKLAIASKQLEELRHQYGVVAAQIEDLMKKNAQNPIPNYQEQLNGLISQRDSISEKMKESSWSQKFYQGVMEEEERIRHNAVIFQVERLLSTHITPTSGFVYDNNLGVPRALAKDTIALRQEQAAIFQQLDQLYYDGTLDLKTCNSMKAEVIKEFNTMVSKAPKPVQPPKRDDSLHTQEQEQSQTQKPQQVAYQEPVEQVDEFTMAFRNKYGYQQMTEQEKVGFDRRVEQAKQQVGMEEQRKKELRDRVKEMGIDIEQVADLESIFRQQQMLEQQGFEEIEEVEHSHGMSM